MKTSKNRKKRAYAHTNPKLCNETRKENVRNYNQNVLVITDYLFKLSNAGYEIILDKYNMT